MAGTFQDKVALVTGGGSGIGRATGLAFAREGAKVVIADLMLEGGEETVKMIKEAGGEAVFVKTDVSLRSAVETLIQKAIEAYGRIDCAFNNAGVGSEIAPTADSTEENWDRVINTNLKGIWLCMKHVIPQMLKQGGGVMVNMASHSGLAGTPNIAPYVASKHGVVGLTKAAALEYGRAGIRINAICPGPIRTPGFEEYFKLHPEFEAKVMESSPMGRVGEPEEIAEAVLWLCSDGASYTTGTAVSADGGKIAQ